MSQKHQQTFGNMLAYSKTPLKVDSTGVQVHWPQKNGRKLKNMQKSDFQATFVRIGALDRCCNLIQKPDFGVL